MGREKLLSIIIPVYNVEKYIERCVKSVAIRNKELVEIILVDDGSTDKSGKLCDELAKQYTCNVVHKENGGLSSARNIGKKCAVGEYLFFLDSDDCVSELFYAQIIPELQKGLYDIIEFKSYWERKYNVFDAHISDKKKEQSIKQCLEDILLNRVGNQICLRIYRSNLFSHIDFPEGKNYEDIDTFHRVLVQAQNVLKLDSELYYYNITTQNSITKSVSLKNMTDMYDAINHFCLNTKTFCIDQKIDLDYVEYYKRNTYIYIYIKLFQNGEKNSALAKDIGSYLAKNNIYNLWKFRHYDWKRWGYYQLFHMLKKI